ncbi:hypothetical protein DL764_007552 [Monosporascus ibericus]|uniref:Uncharacterized protein n=1 Tax=Monosporascus ibericus TaxID=155417 RepID=A0A4Q4T2A5_9PEZI|nr:hypothetical protein DL764_007552 [Monosporascus ibericus]
MKPETVTTSADPGIELSKGPSPSDSYGPLTENRRQTYGNQEGSTSGISSSQLDQTPLAAGHKPLNLTVLGLEEDSKNKGGKFNINVTGALRDNGSSKEDSQRRKELDVGKSVDRSWEKAKITVGATDSQTGVGKGREMRTPKEPSGDAYPYYSQLGQRDLTIADAVPQQIPSLPRAEPQFLPLPAAATSGNETGSQEPAKHSAKPYKRMQKGEEDINMHNREESRFQTEKVTGSDILPVGTTFADTDRREEQKNEGPATLEDDFPAASELSSIMGESLFTTHQHISATDATDFTDLKLDDLPKLTFNEMLSAREIIVQVFLEDEKLGLLFRVTMQETFRGKNTLAVQLPILLSNYSRQLLQHSQENFCRDAAVFVGIQAKHISENILRRLNAMSLSDHPEPIPSLKEWEYNVNKYLKNLPTDFAQDDGDNDREDNIVSHLDQVKDFLRQGPPMQSLRDEFESFVMSHLDEEDHRHTAVVTEPNEPVCGNSDSANIPYYFETLPFLVDYIFGRFSFLFSEPPIPHGKVRLRWICNSSQTILNKALGYRKGIPSQSRVKELYRKPSKPSRIQLVLFLMGRRGYCII